MTHNRGVKWGLLVGWGIVIYSVVFLVWSLLVIHGFVEGLLPRIVLACTLAGVLFLAGKNLRFHHWQDVLPYSIGWLLMALLFDLICAVPVSGWAIWTDWNIWVGYLMVVLVPILTVSSPAHRARSHHR